MNERIEGTDGADRLVQDSFDGRRIVQEVESLGKAFGAGGFNCGERRIRGRVAVGNRDPSEAIASERRRDAGCEATRRARD